MPRVKLGDVAREYKATLKQTKGLPVVGLEHITPGELQLEHWDQDVETTFSKGFKKGQVLFGRRRAYLKKAAVAPFDGVCSGDITVIEAIPGKILPNLLPFVIQNDLLFDFAIGQSAGSLSPRVKWEKLRNYEFNLPEYEQQEAMVELLQAAYAAKRAYQKQMEATDELVKSQFIEEFKQIPKEDYRPLNDVCTLITDGTHNPPRFVDSGIPFILVSNITGNVVTYDTPKYITEETYEIMMKRTPIEKGDVLLSTVGSYGHPAVVVEDKKFAFQRHVAHLKPNKDIIDSRFLHTAILSSDVQEQIEVLVLGVAQKTLNLSAIKKIRIPVPSLDQQKHFIAFVEQSDKSKFELQESIKRVDGLIKSLMQSEN